MIHFWCVVDIGNVLWLGAPDIHAALRKTCAADELERRGARLEAYPTQHGSYVDNPFGQPLYMRITDQTFARAWKAKARKCALSRKFRHNPKQLDPAIVANAIDKARLKKISLHIYPLGFGLLSVKLTNVPTTPDMQAWIFEAFEHSFYVDRFVGKKNRVNRFVGRIAATVRRHLTTHLYSKLLDRRTNADLPKDHIYCWGFSALSEAADVAELKGFESRGRPLAELDLPHSTLYCGWWISFICGRDPDDSDSSAHEILQYADLSWAALKSFEEYFLMKFGEQATAFLHGSDVQRELSLDELRALRMVSECVATFVDVEARANSIQVLEALRHVSGLANLAHMQQNIRYYSQAFADHMRNVIKDAEDRQAKHLQMIVFVLTAASALAAFVAVLELLSNAKLLLVHEDWSRVVPNYWIIGLLLVVVLLLSGPVAWIYRRRP